MQYFMCVGGGEGGRQKNVVWFWKQFKDRTLLALGANKE